MSDQLVEKYNFLRNLEWNNELTAQPKGKLTYHFFKPGFSFYAPQFECIQIVNNFPSFYI